MLETLRELNRRQWSAVVASFLGWTLDAFDFFLMVFMFSAIAKEFHAEISTAAVAATLTLAARPFGALAFGLMADRYGRRPVLMADIVLFSALELASAFAPSLLVLMILRALFGFAMGGEWGVGASLTMETIPAKARGLVSGFLQVGYSTGYLLAAVAFFFLFDVIGWRGLFMVGVIPAILVVFIRLHVDESPTFATQKQAAQPTKVSPWLIGAAALAVAMAPVVAGASDITTMLKWVYFLDAPIAVAGLWFFRRDWKLALYVAVLMTAFNFFSHGTQDLYPTFLGQQHHLGTQAVGLITAIGNLGAIVGGIAFGIASQRWGRRRAIATAALASLLVLPLWAFSHGMALLALGAFAMQVMVQGAWGVIPAHLNELSPKLSRGVFPGYLYQLGNLLASGNAVWQAKIAETHHGGYSLALALVAGAVAIVIAVLSLAGPERRDADFQSPP